MPLGFLTFFCVPDFPENTTVWYLTEAEKELARDRIVKAGQSHIRSVDLPDIGS